MPHPPYAQAAYSPKSSSNVMKKEKKKERRKWKHGIDKMQTVGLRLG